MNTSIWFSVIILLIGIFCILSSYFQWTWWWRLGGAGNWFYNKFGHEKTRLLYAVTGFLMVSLLIRQFIEAIWTTAFGKVVILAFVLVIAGFIFYASRRQATLKNKKNKIDTDETDVEK
jgi:hypothetical protein